MTTAAPMPTPHVEVGFRTAGVVVRGIAYALLADFACGYDCGRALLLGLLVGDLAASVATIAWPWAEHRRHVLAEMAVLALVLVWVRSDLTWPADPAQRAILGLAALGVFAGRTGSSVLTHLGPSENGFS